MGKIPPLRYLDIVPIEHEGQTYICLSDPTGLVDEQCVLTPHAFFVAAHLDGDTSVSDIRDAFRERYNADVREEEIVGIIDQLDHGGFLLNETYHRMRAAMVEDFRDADVREAYFAGRSYPDDPEALRHFLDEQFRRLGGPGEIPGSVPGSGPALPGLVVPHIDFQRGGHSYAHGYLEMYKHGRPDTVIVFGVAHATEPVPFILTRKDFATPFGRLETDVEMVDSLAEACDWDPFQYELTHRTEHSVEFQAVMLGYLYGTDVKIVPVLCSLFDRDGDLTDPSTVTAVERFLDACRKCASDSGKNVTVIAGADLAHVGKRFGDPFDINEDVVADVAERDREDLDFVTGMKAEGFYGSVMRDKNRRRVCGINCIYATLKTLTGKVGAGEQIHYDYAHDPAGGIVSFSAVLLK